MPKTIGLTLTGADESQPLQHYAELNAEIGVLFSLKKIREGHPRYPRQAFVVALSNACQRAAIHICGTEAREALFHGKLDDVVRQFDRIQINGMVEPHELREVCRRYAAKDIVTQQGPTLRNEALLKEDLRNHSILIDASGGRGVLPSIWKVPHYARRIGFAGGLNWENMLAQLGKIENVAVLGSWVDMETGLRRPADDIFSPDRWCPARAHLAISEFARFYATVNTPAAEA